VAKLAAQTGRRVSSRFTRGLVVGKFAPLHRGHEEVIEHALALCDEVVILSYVDPELAGCEREVRETWLQERFPTTRVVVLDRASVVRVLPRNDATDDEQRDFTAWVLTDVLHTTVDAVFTSEAYGEGFARYLSTRLGREVAHVAVDPERRIVPISASRIRDDVHAHRRYLSPHVYASFIERVCLLGGESSGKTTLARALAERFHTQWVHEYGRELWEAQRGQLSAEDLVRIARMQIARELAAARQSTRWLFCDTSPLTTLIYSHAMLGTADPVLERLADRGYHRIVLCAPDFEFVQDGTRRDAAFRQEQHAAYVREIESRGWSYFVASGSVAARVAAIVHWLEKN
jgi:HTH-type transcriptional repressor of NAD biosynthesis genes